VKEGGDVIYEIQLVESIINCNILIILLSWKRSDIERLYIMSKVSGKGNNNNLITEYNERKLRCSVSTYIIVKEEDPFVGIKAGTWEFNEVLKPFDNELIINKSSKRQLNQLLAG